MPTAEVYSNMSVSDRNYMKTINRALLEVLNKYMVADESFTGKIILNLNCGGITSIEKTQVLR